MGYVEITALADGETVGLFALPALFIMLRETLEAAIVLSVLIGLVHRVGMGYMSKYIWFGVGAALFLTIAGGIIVILLVNVAKESLFEGDNGKVAEGAVSVVAAILISIVALSIGDISAIQEKIEAKMLAKVHHAHADEEAEVVTPEAVEDVKLGETAAIAPSDAGVIADAEDADVEASDDSKKKKKKKNVLKIEDLDERDRAELENEVTPELMFGLAFTAVIREGLETIIFFTGITVTYPPESLPIPALVGALIGALCGVLLYRSSGELTIKWFFRITMVLLVFIGAGVWTNGFRELLEAGKLGYWDSDDDSMFVWDATGCCGLDNQFWLLMRVLFGWQPQPVPFDFAMYFGYHAVMWTLVYIKMKRAREGKPGFKALIKYYICRRGEKPVAVPPPTAA
ncbi:Plasma membrane iron permease [Hondaea fermentalgiana]|uniref:Plasma membrane iron permease n=1 Tax=Hondaea fermentalgiana TaxID=2315210 RepID=A0A2R5GLQ5_9STRA|nr:Plasma membrane iron permease [Hondaea fermentalgiana]|eukprot:GBG31807.1 Plasma membrane iron permease [Hondaea fermentalgiana]